MAVPPPPASAPPRAGTRHQITLPVRAVTAAPAAPRPASRRVKRSPKHTLLLVGSALVLIVVGVAADVVANKLETPPSIAATQSQSKPDALVKRLVGQNFPHDVIPPELAAVPPMHAVGAAGDLPGLAGEVSTSTSNSGSSVTIYVFEDTVWAQAFFARPPVPFGCNQCSMSDAQPVAGTGDAATSYVLYRGQSWVATTTYTLRGLVVIAGVYYPLNVANPPSSTDLYVPTAYTKAAIGLVTRAGG